MSLKRGCAAAFLLACCATAAWAGGPLEVSVQVGTAGCADGQCAAGTCATGTCATGCCGWWGHGCCPKICFPREKPPRIKFKCVCPKPVCEPCDLEGYGYYATCWHPWPYPPNCGYCPAPPPPEVASTAGPLIGGPPGPASPGAPPDESLPAPKKAANPNPNR